MPSTLRKFTDSIRAFAVLGAVLLVTLPTVAEETKESSGIESREETLVTFNQEDLTVFKHRFCFCCKDWIEHLQSAGMSPAVTNRSDMGKVKSQWAIPEGFGSCHTAVWRDRYVFEGHVPARLIRQFLSDPPENALGLSVPGMPEGSPGMYKGKDFEPYNVYLLLLGGDYQLYARVTQAEQENSQNDTSASDAAQRNP